MLSRFFIHRPVFASVIAIVTIISGAVSMVNLPVTRYPDISPPTVRVSAFYPGAGARVLSETVARPIEEQINGVQDMLYMSSTCASDGAYTLTVSFKVGTDLDLAAVRVQNRVAVALARLPEQVQRLGVKTEKQSTNVIMFITLVSSNPRHDELFISNYVTRNIKDELARLDGVGSVFTFGAGNYSMRIWLDPERLKARRLTTNDVVQAIREQNVQVAAGQIGQAPAPADQKFQYTVTATGRLTDAEQFEDIILKTDPTGGMTRIKDVARVELGSQTYDVSSFINGRPTAAVGIFQLPGANALDVANSVRAKMEELSHTGAFREGLDYIIPYDTTRFVRASIREVVLTLFIAVGLVFLTLYVFLQDWRATLIPAATIPVSLVGTFMVMSALGFSINMITLFGLVLAIGIVVDDAIVVVENATRHIDTAGLAPPDAAIRAMDEVTGPVIATTLVLLAVFVPAAFLGGVTGQLYRQFAVTIATATVFSSINALTLSPALCALVLRRAPQRRNIFFRAFNWTFARGSGLYAAVVRIAVRRIGWMLLLFAILSGLAYRGYRALPAGFMPTEDQGYLIATMQLPDAASKQRTLRAVKRVDDILKATPGVDNYVSVAGYSLLDGSAASNAATFWIVLDPWDERLTPDLGAQAIAQRIQGAFFSITEANVFVLNPPAIMGLGSAGGFELRLQDRANVGPAALQTAATTFVHRAMTDPAIAAAFTTFRANVPQLFADIDRTKVKRLGIALSSVFDTLQAYLGSVYVNDFSRFGRTYQVRVQADPSFRARADNIKRLDVRNDHGEMVPLGTVVNVKPTVGPQFISRFNVYPAATLIGAAARGTSSAQALDALEHIADQTLPDGIGYAWSGMSYQEKSAGAQGVFIFGLAVVFVYLVLCAQYESWLIPVAVILVVPLAVLGTVVAILTRGMDNNVYTQIGIVLLVAMAGKNAILIVEFARDLRAQGRPTLDAATEAARLRFRPVLMTALTFILGVLPLVFANGAAAASRQAVGTTVLGGMLAATILGVVFAPVFFVLVQRARDHRNPG